MNWQNLWNLLPHPQGSVIRWMAKRDHRVMGDHATSARDLALAAKTFPHWNFYLCPNPSSSRTGIRHSTGDVTHWSWFLLDIDPGPNWQAAEPDKALVGALEVLSDWLSIDFIKQPPTVIDSGRGRQAWFRLSDVVLDEDGTVDGLHTSVTDALMSTRRHVASRTMKWWLHKLDEKLGLTHGCRVDTTTSDLPRPMRCPGTTNQKTCNNTRLVTIGEAYPGLAWRLVNSVPKHEFVEVVPTGPGAGLPWQLAFAHLTRKAQQFIQEGWQEPGRHEAMWHTAKRLQEAGVTREEARKALWAGNQQCRLGDGSAGVMSEREVNHALNTAYGKEAYGSKLSDTPWTVAQFSAASAGFIPHWEPPAER